MGELVPVSNSSLIVKDPEQEEQLREDRIKEAQQLEETLTAINQLPTRIYNVSGSAAGAGSGDFHYYRLIRRAEQDRLRRLDAEHKLKSEKEEFEVKVKTAQAELEAKTAKKRAKRAKQKAKKKQKGQAGAAAGDGANSDAGGTDSDSDVRAAEAGPVPEQQDVD